LPTRSLSRRVTRITAATTLSIDPSFRRLAAAVIRFGGQEPTPNAVRRLAEWLHYCPAPVGRKQAASVCFPHGSRRSNLAARQRLGQTTWHSG